MSNPFDMAYSMGDFLLRQRMQHMIVHVTTACNFRCAHCFVDFESSKRDLKLEHFQQLAADSPPLLWLDIGGGEPFLRKDLAEIVCAFDSKIVHIPTNGSLIPQMLNTVNAIRARSDREIIIGLSVDGLRETHDRIRKQPGNYDQIWEAYRALRGIPGVSIKVCTVINSKNIDEILPLMEEVQAHGVDFHSVILLRGKTLDPDMVLPSLPRLHALAGPMFEILGNYTYGKNPLSAHLLRNFHRYLWNVSMATLEQQTQIIPCLAGRSQVVVFGDGNVSACEMLPTVGNIRDARLPDIISSDAYQQQLRHIADKQCHCTHNCAMLDSILLRPASLPHLLYQHVR